MATKDFSESDSFRPMYRQLYDKVKPTKEERTMVAIEIDVTHTKYAYLTEKVFLKESVAESFEYTPWHRGHKLGTEKTFQEPNSIVLTGENQCIAFGTKAEEIITEGKLVENAQEALYFHQFIRQMYKEKKSNVIPPIKDVYGKTADIVDVLGTFLRTLVDTIRDKIKSDSSNRIKLETIRWAFTYPETSNSIKMIIHESAQKAGIHYSDIYILPEAEAALLFCQNRMDKYGTVSHQMIVLHLGGMLIIMGINNVPDYKFYWSGNKFLCNQGFKDVMPVKRYEKLNQYFHANDNTIEIPVGEPGHDKLHKIRPFINSSMANFSDRYKPNKNQSVDEAMVAYRGRYGAKQYIPSKPIKWGFKVWMRCDRKSGCCHQYHIYMGKEHGVNYRNKGLGQRVVEKLTEPIRNKNHHIYFDSYFTSIPLMRSLLNDGMYACGTIRSNRKGFPEDLKKPPRMPTGQFIGRQTEDMVALVWMDSKVVSVVATNESLTEVDVTNRRQKNGTNLQISRPRAVTNYQEHFRGVDVCDQLRTKYAVGRPSKKWWKYLLHFIIDLCIIDAFIVMQEGPQVERARKRFRQIDFRVNLAMQLIGDFSCSNTRRAVNGPVIRASHVHVKLNRKRSSCKLCPKTGAKKRKTTQFGCERCNTHLCSVQCYTEFHRQAGIPVIIEE